MNIQPNEFTDIAELAWSSNPITDEDLTAERDRVRFLVGHVLRGAPDLGGERALAVSWIAVACALVDAMPAPQLYAHLHSLPAAFQRALEAAASAARVVDHKRGDREWLDEYRDRLKAEIVAYDQSDPEIRSRDAWERLCQVKHLLNASNNLYGSNRIIQSMPGHRTGKEYTKNLDSIRAITWFQERVRNWTINCFGEEIAADTQERNHRFLEEALELVQACGCSASEAHQLVDYVYGRPVGEKSQEAGGVMLTLAALCQAQGFPMGLSAFDELERVNCNIEKIRAKQAAKPKHGPLP